MRLFFLDDNRGRRTDFKDFCPKEHTVVVAHNFDTAVKLFTQEPAFDMMFLDHDLGEKQTGYDFVKHIVNTSADKIPPCTIVHSNNSVGGPRMVYLLRDFNKVAYWSMFVPSKRWITQALEMF